MEKEALYDIIERYLAGKLEADERLEVENRLASDPDFRAEVALHRDLHAEFGDPDKLRLQAALDQLRRNPPGDTPEIPAPIPPTRRKWWRIIGVATVIVALFAYFLWQRAHRQAGTPPLPVPENTAPPGQPDSTPKPPAGAPKPEPIARANPKDFVPNPSLEDRITDQGRGGAASDTRVELSSPVVGATLRLQQGAVTIPIRGTVTGDLPLPADRPLRLFIYSNRPEEWNRRQPLYTLPLPVKPVKAKKEHDINFQQRLELPPGLYYVAVGQAREAADGEGYQFLWFGKVEVRAGY